MFITVDVPLVTSESTVNSYKKTNDSKIQRLNV